jgi:hypothetical protein
MSKLNYFTTSSSVGEEFVSFVGNPIPSSVSPVFNILRELEMTPTDFAEKANRLFDKHNIKVRKDYPKKASLKLERLWGDVRAEPWDEFAICVGCCILIEERFGVDVSRIIRNELIEQNSREGIRHASSLAALVLYYLNKGSEVTIEKEESNAYNPDLIIDRFHCELKVVDASDWTGDIDPSSGQGRQRSLSESICFDIGTFLRDRGYKGIKQADVVFADLSLKSLGLVHENGWITAHKSGLPALRQHRIVYFVKEIIQYYGFFIDFDPDLWDLIKNTETRYSFGVFPWKATETSS